MEDEERQQNLFTFGLMGCVGSKHKRCSYCHAPYSPVRRSYSVHTRRKRDNQSYHVVSLTSTTLGSLKLDHYHDEEIEIDDSVRDSVCDGINGEIVNGISKEFLAGINEAKAWSSLIEEKIPKMPLKTPITTPPGEPETVNTWEIMEGLEDASPFRSPNYTRSFSFEVVKIPNLARVHSKPRFQDNGTDPIWVRMASGDYPNNPNSFVSPEVISSFKKEKVILYFTSLRGVRKTYEDCCNVRVILKGIGVKVDERDVSMHLGFREELKELLGGDKFSGLLPRVFVRKKKKYIGGAEEVRTMHDEGKLEKALEGCKMAEEIGVCEVCGGIRFVPCDVCFGSCKVYYEELESSVEGEGEFGFQRCPDCNENGLLRCPICCD